MENRAWKPDGKEWAMFKNLAFARHGASSIVAKFTPAGRELSKLIARYREMDGYGWLDKSEDISEALGGLDGEAMALADVLYWAVESGALGGRWRGCRWYHQCSKFLPRACKPIY